jgi:hypothetical protein
MRFLVKRSLTVIVLIMLIAAGLHGEGGARFTATSTNVSGAGETIKISLTDWSPDSRRDEFVAAWTLTVPAAQGRGGRGGAGGAGRGAAGGGARGARGGAGRGTRGGDAATAPAAVPDLPADPDAVDPDNPAPARGRGGARGGGGGAAPTQTPEASLAAAIKKAPTVGILWTSESVGYSIKYAYRLPQPDGGERIILATDRPVGMWSNLWKPVASVKPTDYTFSIIELRVNPKGEGEGRGVLAGKVAVDTASKTIALDDYATLPVILKGVKRQSGN